MEGDAKIPEMAVGEGLSLGQAVASYLATLPPEQREAVQSELNSFVRWYGGQRPLASLSIQEVAIFAERAGTSPAEWRRVETVKGFFTFAKKQKLTLTNLAVHLRLKKAGSKKAVANQEAPSFSITPEGYSQLVAEVEGLKQQRQHLVQEVQRARADRDFKENAPLDAAREQQARVEARIREIEAILAGAKVVEVVVQTIRVETGSVVTVRDLASGEQARYQIVHPQEVNPTQGKISVASPLGKALLGHQQGEGVEIATPRGSLRFIIEEVRASS